MRLGHYDENKLKREIRESIGKHLDLGKYKVFFFGSRVSGGGDEYSDIDVGVEGPEPVPAGAMLEIKEAMEQLPTLYRVEVTDFNRVGKNFEQVAKQQIEMVN